MARLVVREGENAGTVYEIPEGKERVVLGRESGMDVQLSDPKASRQHTEIVVEDDRFVIRDLQSRNGTYLNGRRIERDEELAPGSRIRIGNTVLDFLDETGGVPPGLEIAGYEITERLGQGRMGTVYKARQLSMHRLVAVKVLNERYGRDEAFLARFVREAQEAGKLNHANIVHMFDAKHENDVHYFSMELVEGMSVKRLLRRDERLGVDKALDIVLQTAEALRYAHECGVIHRDVKPASIMVTREGEVKIADLGIAKTFDEPGDSRVQGTPHYMSPEQALGKEVDARSDIYSLGATLYHMLTGSIPFQGDDDYEVISAHSTASLPAIQETEPDVPDSVVAIVEKMMAREPDNRYRSMAGLKADIGKVIADRQAKVGGVVPGESSVSRPVAAVVRSQRKRIARKRALKGGAGALSGLGAAIGIALLLLAAIIVVHQLVSPMPSSTPRRPRRGRLDGSPRVRITHTADGRPISELAPETPPSAARTSAARVPGPDDIDDTGDTPTPAEDPGPAAAGPVEFRPGPAPRLTPELLVCTYVGGRGDQYIKEVGFLGDGSVFGRGNGFQVTYDTKTRQGRVQGDIDRHDPSRYGTRPPLPGGRGKSVRDPRDGRTYRVGCRQVHPTLQQPFLSSSAGWELWGLDYGEVNRLTKTLRWGPLTADSRAYDCWPMPGGRIGVVCWTSDRNSVLTRDPRDVARPNPIEEMMPYKKTPDGMATLYMLVDPKDGAPLSGTFLGGHVTRRRIDPWGRVYIPKAYAGASNPFDMAPDAGAGLTVLHSNLLRPERNIRIGGGAGEGGKEMLGRIELKENILLLGGTTPAGRLKTVKAVQEAPGGGQDGLFVVIRLWE